MADRKAVLIGGGITGALTAAELAARGWDVTLLEARHIGAGSSSRTAAGIRQQFSTPGTVRAMRYSVRFYKQFAGWSGQGNGAIVQNGYLFLYDDEEAWLEAVARIGVQRVAGLREVEALPRKELLAVFPWACGEGIIGGTFCPTDGFLHPDVIYNDAIARARELGVEVMQKAPVTGALRSNAKLIGVQTSKGLVAGDVFIDCTNAWTRRTARILGAEELQVDPLKRYIWFLKRGGPMTSATLSTMPLCIAPSGAYFRPENPESLLMGKKHNTPPHLDFDYEDQDIIERGFDPKEGLDTHPYDIWAEVAEAVPDIGEYDGITATTCGYYATTPDHNPFLGYDRQLHNLIRLVGFSGHGAMMGPFNAAVGVALAETGCELESLSLDGGEPVKLEPFRIGRRFEYSEAMVI